MQQRHRSQRELLRLHLSPIAVMCIDHIRRGACLPPRAPLTHHHPMWAIRRFALAALAIGTCAAGMAGEATSGRVLLQPPAVVVPSPITDRFAVTARFTVPMMETFFRYDDPQNPSDTGTPFYVEDTLGLKGRMFQGSIDLMFRISERHRIQAQYSQQSRAATKTLDLDGPLLFGGSEFDNGDVLHSQMEQRKLDVVYTYSILRRERIELGLGLGVHLLQFAGTLEEPAEFRHETLDTAGPAASLAGDFTWRISRRLSLVAQGQWLRANVADVDGEYRSYRANLQYRAARNMAIGVGYAGTYYEVDSADPDFFSGYLWIHDHGPEAFIRVSF